MSKRKKDRRREGRCKLLQLDGTYVDSHLLPKSLTRADGLGPGLIQLGYGRKTKRFSSWYDPALVIQEGEDILSAYDDWAIPVLRRKKMVWSGWGPMVKLTDVIPLPGFPIGHGARLLGGEDWKRLRLFFLSLLWRAAASDRPEFAEIVLPDADLEQLRVMVRDGNPEPIEFYAVTLSQLSTLGINHNASPFAMNLPIPALDGGAPRDRPVFRFYLDGLIIYFSRASAEETAALDLGPLLVGGDQNLTISAIPFEGSSQEEDLFLTGVESELGRPWIEYGEGPFTRSR